MQNKSAGVLIALVLAGPCVAQETTTEREAAREVVKQIAGLSPSLGVPAMVRSAFKRPRRSENSRRIWKRMILK
jgi:hypothetical protein